MLVDPPAHLSKPPSRLHVLSSPQHSRHSQLHGELADGMDDGRENDVSGDVGGWEDSSRGLVVARHDGPLHLQWPFKVKCIIRGRYGVRRQLVVDDAQGAIRRRRQVTLKEIAERKQMGALFQRVGLLQELHLEQIADLGGAIGTMHVNRFLGRHRSQQYQRQARHPNLPLVDGQD